MAITINVNLDEILAALKNDLDFAGSAGLFIRANATEDGFEFAAAGGGSVNWGGIGGNLPDQTDLQNALNLKANLAGASFTGAVSVSTSGSGDTLQLTNSGSGTTLNILNSGSGDFLTIDTNKFVVSNNGNLAVDTNTLFVDAVNNRVGIGTATPAKTFDVVLDASNRIQFEAAFGGARIYFEQGTFDSYIFSNAGSIELNSVGFNKSISYAAYLNHSFTNGSATTFQIQRGGGTVTTINTASQIGAIIQAAAGQTANLQEWRDSAGTILARVRASGEFNVGLAYILSNEFGLGNNIMVFNAAPSGVGSQVINARVPGGNTTSSIMHLRNNANAIVFSVLNNGAVRFVQLSDSAAPNDSVYYSTDSGKLVYKDSGGVVNNLY